MSSFEPSPSPWTGRMLSVLRIMTGLNFLSAGTMKLFGRPPPPPPPPPYPIPPIPLLSQIGIGGMLESAGGTAIIVGLFTRPVAFVLAGEMAVAYFQFHFPQSVNPATNHGVPAVLCCFIFLYLFLYVMLAGAGPWSVDATLVRSRRASLPAGAWRHALS